MHIYNKTMKSLHSIVPTQVCYMPVLSHVKWTSILGSVVCIKTVFLVLHIIIHHFGAALTVHRTTFTTTEGVLFLVLAVCLYTPLHLLYFSTLVHRTALVVHVLCLCVHCLVFHAGLLWMSYLFGWGGHILYIYVQGLSVVGCTVYCKYLTVITLGSICHTITFIYFILYSHLIGWVFLLNKTPITPFMIIYIVNSVLVWWYSHIYVLYYLDKHPKLAVIPAVMSILTSPIFCMYALFTRHMIRVYPIHIY
jgi:hypothetical protein